MHDYLVDWLECPACHGALTWQVAERRGTRIEEAEARCGSCDATYPIREGIGLFLTPDLPRRDLWDQAESRLAQHLREQPEVERRLMEGPAETLAPADLFYRAMVLEERGDYAQAQVLADRAYLHLYTPEYRAGHASQLDYAIQRLASGEGPVVDLASGRGDLVERLARELQRPVVATDFSPRVLRRDRRWLEFWGLYDRVSLLAFDARRTPFKDGAVDTLTTNLGLPNIAAPGDLLRELRRVVAGTFLAISHFYPEDDEANAAAIRQAGLAAFLFRDATLAEFAAAGWQVEVVNRTVAPARPTPTGVVLEGAGIDGLPVAETELEWCVLVAR